MGRARARRRGSRCASCRTTGTSACRRVADDARLRDRRARRSSRCPFAFRRGDASCSASSRREAAVIGDQLFTDVLGGNCSARRPCSWSRCRAPTCRTRCCLRLHRARRAGRQRTDRRDSVAPRARLDETTGGAARDRASTAGRKLAGVIGWPLDHTLSPAMHNAAYEAMGLDWVYLPLPVRDEADAAAAVVGASACCPFVGLQRHHAVQAGDAELCDEVADAGAARGRGQHVHCVRRAAHRLQHRRARACSSRSRTRPASTPEGKRVVAHRGGRRRGRGARRARARARPRSVTVVEPRRASAPRTWSSASRSTLRDTEVVGGARWATTRARRSSGADLVVNATPARHARRRRDARSRPSWLQRGPGRRRHGLPPGDHAAARAARSRRAPRAVGGLGMLVAQGAIADRHLERGTADRALRAT